MSEYSDARTKIKAVAEALDYVESDFYDMDEDAPRSDMDKGFSIVATAIPEQNDKPSHLSDILMLDISVQVADRCQHPEDYQTSLSNLEALVKALSLKFDFVDCPIEPPTEDFFISTINLKSRRV